MRVVLDSPCQAGAGGKRREASCTRLPDVQTSGTHGRDIALTARKKDQWKTITHKVLWPAVEAIRTQFGILAWKAAKFYEKKCYKELTAENRSRTEPEIFLHHFAAGFSKFLTTQVSDTFNKVFEIASKNRVKGGPVEWTRLQLTFMVEDKLRLSGKASRVRDWVAYACDGYYLTNGPAHEEETIFAAEVPFRGTYVSPARDKVRDSWLAPRWLRAHPYDPRTASDREGEERSQRILKEQSDMVASLLERELKRLAERADFHRAVTPIEPMGALETATSAEQREGLFKLPPRQGRDRLLEESEGALTEKQYRALDLKMNFKLTDTDIGRAMGTSRQGATKLLVTANRNMTAFLKNRKAKLREPKEGQR